MYPEYPDYMNYNNYNNYPMYYPYPPMPRKPPLLYQMRNSLTRTSWNTTLKNTQKTIYTINQIIPIVYQLKPVLTNATQAFRIAKAVKQFDFDDIDNQITQPDSETYHENVI